MDRNQFELLGTFYFDYSALCAEFDNQNALDEIRYDEMKGNRSSLIVVTMPNGDEFALFQQGGRYYLPDYTSMKYLPDVLSHLEAEGAQIRIILKEEIAPSAMDKAEEYRHHCMLKGKANKANDVFVDSLSPSNQEIWVLNRLDKLPFPLVSINGVFLGPDLKLYRDIDTLVAENFETGQLLKRLGEKESVTVKMKIALQNALREYNELNPRSLLFPTSSEQ